MKGASGLYSRVLLLISTLILGASCSTMRQEIRPAPWDEQSFEALDHTRFPYIAWRAEAFGVKPKAVILAVHGLGGAASDWRPLGEHFQKRGISVYAYELRGMGNDPVVSRRGDVRNRREWFEDFAGFALRLQETYPDTPIIWYGESLGGIISLHMMSQAEELGLRPHAFILASPIVQVDGKLPFWQSFCLHVMAKLLPEKRLDLESLAPPDTPPAQVVSTVTHRDQLTRTPHAITRFSLRLLEQIAQTVRENRWTIRGVEVPIVILYSGHDVFTKPREVERFFETIPESTPREKHFYPDGYHLLLHDRDRQQVLRDVETWISRLLPPLPPDAGKK